jgi:hypothetical protein
MWASQEDVDAMVKALSRYMQSHGVPTTGADAPVRRTINPVYRLVINTSATV